jgi:hypothetical protein
MKSTANPKEDATIFSSRIVLKIYSYVTVVIRQLRPEFKFPAKIDLSFSQLLAFR